MLLIEKNCSELVQIVLDKPKIGFQFGPGTKTYFRYVLNFTFCTLSQLKVYLGPVQNRFGPTLIETRHFKYVLGLLMKAIYLNE